MSKLQLTLSILKPHIVKYPTGVQIIKDIIKENNLKIIKGLQTHLSRDIADTFYAEHRTKFFYNRLQTFMCR